MVLKKACKNTIFFEIPIHLLKIFFCGWKMPSSQTKTRQLPKWKSAKFPNENVPNSQMEDKNLRNWFICSILMFNSRILINKLYLCELNLVKKHLQWKRVVAWFSCCKIYNNCRRWENLSGGLLQPWRYHFRRLSREIAERYAVTCLGNQTAERIYPKGKYKKYQQHTLSQVEKDFLDNIKTLPSK